MLTLRPVARLVARTLQRLRGDRFADVRAVALTPEGRIVLIRHHYLPGWYLPGGGRRLGADAKTAILRELREEIGMGGYTKLHAVNGARAADGGMSLFLLDGVRFRPRRWSLEIEAVSEFALDALPADATPRTRANIALAIEGLHRTAPRPG